MCTTLNVIDDDVLEGNENFEVSLTSPTGGANLEDPMTATITIVDNESMMIIVTLKGCSSAWQILLTLAAKRMRRVTAITWRFSVRPSVQPCPYLLVRVVTQLVNRP